MNESQINGPLNEENQQSDPNNLNTRFGCLTIGIIFLGVIFLIIVNLSPKIIFGIGILFILIGLFGINKLREIGNKNSARVTMITLLIVGAFTMWQSYDNAFKHLDDDQQANRPSSANKDAYKESPVLSPSKPSRIILSIDERQKLSKYLLIWGKRILIEKVDFICSYKCSDTSITFTLCAEASKSLEVVREMWIPILTSKFKENVISELGEKYSKYPLKIEIEAKPGTKSELETYGGEWIPAEYLWYNVRLYFGSGNGKKYIGKVVGGIIENGQKFVVIEKSDGTLTYKSKTHISTSYYYLKAGDPNVKGKLLKFK